MNYTLLNGDKYLLNMLYAHWKTGGHNRQAVYELFYRKPPFGGNFVIFSGLRHLDEYINNLKCTIEDIDWIMSQPEEYDFEFIRFLRSFKFDGRIESVCEGDFIFPHEPMIKVYAPLYQGMIIGSALLAMVNYECLVATKAARIRIVADDDELIEMGMRRAHGLEAGIWAAYASRVGGFDYTSNMAASYKFGIPAVGTMAHEWVQSFVDEYDAFINFIDTHGGNTTLLVDTYNTLTSGVPNAIKAAKYLEERGKRLRAIRLDSGNLLELSILSRKMLDEAGLNYVKIVASNDLDEFSIRDLKSAGAKIDIWGIGTKLITGVNQSSLGGVYKLVAIQEEPSTSNEYEGKVDFYRPVGKVSETKDKSVIPGSKYIYRHYDEYSSKAVLDVISYDDMNEYLLSKMIYGEYDPLLMAYHYSLDTGIIFDEAVREMPDYVLDIEPQREYEVKLDERVVAKMNEWGIS